MNVLLLSLLKPATGNFTTAQRIRSHLEQAGHTVFHHDVLSFSGPDDVQSIVERGKMDAALGIHALGAGKWLRFLDIPYVLVFGGTDVNEQAKNPAELAMMTEAIERASVLVSYNDDFIARASEQWPQQQSKMVKIPKGVEVHPSKFSLWKNLGLPDDSLFFLLPAGLRPVKDPMFLIQKIMDWHAEDSRIHLVIAGNPLDESVAAQVRAVANPKRGITLIDPLPQTDLHAAMQEAFAVLNTSKSESSANSPLEAMALGTPVIVRDIPGNRASVEHEKTGLLFTTPEEFRTQAQSLIDDPELRSTLIKNAKAYVAKEHSVKNEAEAYQKLFSPIP